MRPEILAPVGSFSAFYAALNAKADAIYLAGEAYGARKAIEKFSLDDIKRIIEISHLYNVKVYVTINTLIFDDEIEELLKYSDKLYEYGVDAILIQDLGLLNIFTKRYKDLDIHISTQANVKTLEEVKFFEKEPNVKRIVLARETPIEEIKRIKENSRMEIEVFVHGAICMSYSGNCLFSSMAFSRSGNRGECAQPCRLKYSLFENGKLLDDDKYLLSPKELSTIEYLDQLIEIGVDSFKIEGRIKSPEYVALTTSVYKEMVLNPSLKISDITIDKLKRAYNRDFTKGYIFNITPSSIVNDYRPNHMGVYLGTIISNNYRIKIKLENTLNRLDGIRIISRTKDDYGMIVDKIYKNGTLVEKANPNDTVEIESYKMPKFKCNGLKVYVTSSISIKEEFKDYIDNKINRNDSPLDLKILIKKDEYPILEEINSKIKIVGDFKALEASNKPLTNEIVFNQINKLVDTPYRINNIDFEIDNNIFVPLGVLNNLRRELVDKLKELRINKYSNRTICKDYEFTSLKSRSEDSLFIKVETFEQFIESYNFGFRDFIILNNILFNKIKKSYQDINATLMLDRIIENYDNIDMKSKYLSNEVGSIENNDVIIGPYLNSTNIYSANYLFNRGAKEVILSYEMNKENIINFSDRYYELFNSRPNIGLVLYDKVDLMIMKYCLIAGHYKTKPHCNLCKNNIYKLKDRNDTYNEIITNESCNNRILNSKTLCLFEYKELIKKSKINSFLICFTTETKEEVKMVLDTYLKDKTLSGINYTYGRFIK